MRHGFMQTCRIAFMRRRRPHSYDTMPRVILWETFLIGCGQERGERASTRSRRRVLPAERNSRAPCPEKFAVLLRKIGNAAEHMRQHCEIGGCIFVEKRTGDRRAKTAFSLPTKAIPLQRASFLEIRAETFPTERNPNETTERSARGRPVLYRATLPPVRKFDR